MGENLIWLMEDKDIRLHYKLPSVTNLDWHISEMTDLNGDGKKDILWRNEATGHNWSWLLDGASVLESKGIPMANTDWQIVNVKDRNNDVQDDLLWRNKKTGAVWS